MEWDVEVVRSLERMTIFQRERLRVRVEQFVRGEGRDRATLEDLEIVRRTGMGRAAESSPLPEHGWPVLPGAFQLGDPSAPVAVCTLASAGLVGELGRPNGTSIVGRAFTENLGVEKVALNIVANPAIRVLALCGTESRHRVGETLKALHANGLDANGAVAGSTAPLPLLRNVPLRAQEVFSAKLEIIDMIGECNVEKLRQAIADAARAEPKPWHESWTSDRATDRVHAKRESGQRPEDAAGFLLISLGPYRDRIVVEHYSREAELRAVFEGRAAEELSSRLVDAGAVSDLSHAAYAGRELLKAEVALVRGLQYEQDRELAGLTGRWA
jgi:tetrahydromethanopterin S-methyltransferase subunit A